MMNIDELNNIEAMKTSTLFSLEHTLLRDYLEGHLYPWEALTGIDSVIRPLGNRLADDPDSGFKEISSGVYVHYSAKIAPTAYLGSPCIICAGTELRHGAFVRGSVVVGEDCVVGNSVELKNCILFDGVHVPHFNYVGDSILGYKAHLGAGAITSNVKSLLSPKATPCTGENISIRYGGEKIPTNLRKFGAMLGDHVEIGCNTVLNPGTVIGKRTCVYPLASLRGYYPPDSIVKNAETVVPRV